MFGDWSHTGFGVVTEELGKSLLAAGADIRILAGNHRGEPIRGPLNGSVWPIQNLRNYVSHVEATAITGALWSKLEPSDFWSPDVVLVISDVSGFLGLMEVGAEQVWQSKPLFHYCPIEGDNLPPIWKNLWKFAQPVAMARYGQQVISQHIGQPVAMVYHGVDAQTFRPVSMNDPMTTDDGKRIMTKEGAKAHFGLDPRHKIVFRSDRLVERKFYHSFVAAMAEVVARDPSVRVLTHCRMQDNDNMDLVQEIARLPVEIGEKFLNTNAHDSFRGMSRNELAILMNAADLYVTTTGGEGFGLNLAESLACEVPVVTSDWAAEGEVVGPGGVLIPPLHDSYGEVVRYHSRYGMDWAVPDPKAFVEPTLQLLAKSSRRRALGEAGRRHVIANFNWDMAATAFLDLFEERQAAVA